MVVATNFEPPTEGIRHREINTQAIIRRKDLGKGTLYITESRLSWKGNDDSGFSLEYPHIQLHAVSRDPTVASQPCLFLIVEGDLLDGQENGSNENRDAEQNSDDENDDGGERSSPTTEIRFIPDSDVNLDAMYKAMCECQALHPDPRSDSDEDGEEYDIDGAEQEMGVDAEDPEGPEGPTNGQFDDAD